MADIFLNAEEARSESRNASVIHAEVSAIEAIILANIDAGVLYANVTSGTTMTDGTEYYTVFTSATSNPAITDQLNCVVAYFEDLSYAVNITESPAVSATIGWNISW